MLTYGMYKNAIFEIINENEQEKMRIKLNEDK